jgi:spore coat protein A
LITRRTLLAGLLLAGARARTSIAQEGRTLVTGVPENPWSRALDEYGRARPASYSRPLPVPPTLAPVRRDESTDYFELAIERGIAQPLPGKATEIWGYDGLWPGPTIEVQRGRTARLRVHNRVHEPMSVHNHGQNCSSESDGHPIDYIQPGAVKEYVYPNAQSAGTYWLHDHALLLTGPHVYRGLAAFYLIKDPAEQALGLPERKYDVPILLQDRLFDTDQALSYSVGPASINGGFLGNTSCANGAHTPYFEVEARKYRFRFLNGANARNYRLSLLPPGRSRGDGDPFWQIASDGSLLERPLRLTACSLAPGERCDCVIDFSHYRPGSAVLLTNLDPTWPELPDILQFRVLPAAGDPSRLPDTLCALPRLAPQQASARRRIVFQLRDGKWTMNGLSYDPARIDFQPRLGSTEIWELVNAEATQMHPFHQHLVPFQVLELDERPPPAELRGWKDTLAVGPHGSARIIMKFTGFKGVYVFHCHKLEHEDHAMMLQQEVV